MEPLDPNLNAAILAIAKRLFPDGFDVSDDAPDTYEKLKAHLDAGNRMLVYGGGSQHTIYADPAVNHAFRAWHDWTHWTGQHDLTFKGEIAVCTDQRRFLSRCSATRRRSNGGPRSSRPRSSAKPPTSSSTNASPSISEASSKRICKTLTSRSPTHFSKEK